MEAAVQELAKSPKLVIYSQQIIEILTEEARRREKFLEELTEDTRAEFINGEVVVHSPCKVRHFETVASLSRLMGVYVDIRMTGLLATENAMITLSRNYYQPDIIYYKKEKRQKLAPDQMLCPAPDLVVEILSPSTARNDRGVKFEDYATHGIGEYWIVDPETEVVEQYLLEGDAYALKIKATDGHISSRVIEGFEIPIRAIFDEKEKAAALAALMKKALENNP
jgi:Uma2 family endonuclease